MPDALNKFYNDFKEPQKKTEEPYIGITRADKLDFEYRIQGDRKIKDFTNSLNKRSVRVRYDNLQVD